MSPITAKSKEFDWADNRQTEPATASVNRTLVQILCLEIIFTLLFLYRTSALVSRGTKLLIQASLALYRLNILNCLLLMRSLYSGASRIKANGFLVSLQFVISPAEIVENSGLMLSAR